MATTPGQTTELEAVNTMLSAIGEAPVVDLDASPAMAEVALARAILAETSKKVQVRGWNFNQELEYPLAIDGSGFINVPTNCVRAKISDSLFSKYPNLTLRGTKVYNQDTHSYVFTETLKFSLILYLDFDSLPEMARSYIAVRAARILQDRFETSETLHAYTEADEMQALADLKEYEGDTANYSIFDNYDVARTLDRDSYSNGGAVNPSFG